MILKVSVALLIALVAFIAWRYTSVARGATARDEALLRRIDPIAQRMEAKTAVDAGEIHALALAAELRPMIYMMLSHHQRLELFPKQFLSEQSQAESALAYWMLHPNELQAASEQIELAERLERNLSGALARFYVFRYKMPEGHWSGREWQLGVAGPYRSDSPPYQGGAGAFSRAGDVETKLRPAELVDWYVGTVMSKSGGA